MDQNKKTSQISDDQPGNVHPDDNSWTSPAKRISEIEHLDIKESESGRDRSQTPDTENLDQHISQIDPGTKQMREKAAEDGENNPQEGNPL